MANGVVRILVTNDDGVMSKGLAALAEAMRPLGKVYIVAPERERGAIGHAVTLHKPLRITRLHKDVYSVNGTPSDCVLLGVTTVLPDPPHLVVSGINRGVNLGDDVTYSGTVSAALEAALLGFPAVAFSLEGRDRFRFRTAAHYATKIGRCVLRFGLPNETLLNVNVPDRSLHAVCGVRLTSLSRRRFDNPVVAKVDPRGRTYYWIAGSRVAWERRKDSDYQAVRNGWVSMTPLLMDLTDYGALARLRPWEAVLDAQRVKRRHSMSRRPRSVRLGQARGLIKRPSKQRLVERAVGSA